jgi:peptidoglycan/xylan/chitin deacetylase (PgdA/CDA1 family)
MKTKILIVTYLLLVGAVFSFTENLLIEDVHAVNYGGEKSTSYDAPIHKIVILRSDDVSNVDPAIRWMSNLTIEKDLRTTYALIPMKLEYDTGLVNYLENLDKEHFEIGTHGYAHENFSGLPYEDQYNLIKNSIELIEDKLHIRPYTFITPYSEADINTTEACIALGYHSISEFWPLNGDISYIDYFNHGFNWENFTPDYNFKSFDEFKDDFDRFYRSTGDTYLIIIHPSSMLNESGKINKTSLDTFEKSIDYIKSKNVDFMTLEQAHKWRIMQRNETISAGDTASKTINWSGYDWNVKSGGPLNPGICFWSTDNVWVDSENNLHLKISKYGNIWYCAEVWTKKPLPYGKYQLWVEGQIDKLDKNVVLGFFNYPSNLAFDNTSEIDIEISRFGDENKNNGNYGVYPRGDQCTMFFKDCMYKNGRYNTTFPINLTGTYTTHRFVWQSDRIEFQSLHGHREWNDTTDEIYSSVTPPCYAKCVPVSPLALHINLWLYDSKPPSYNKSVEVVIKKFEFIPES